MGAHPALGGVWTTVRTGFWPGHIARSKRADIIRDAGVAAQRGRSGCFETRRRLAAMDRLRAGPYYRLACLRGFERSVIKRYPLKALIKTQALHLRRTSFEAKSCGSKPLFSLRGEAKWVKGTSVRGLRRSAPRLSNEDAYFNSTLPARRAAAQARHVARNGDTARLETCATYPADV